MSESATASAAPRWRFTSLPLALPILYSLHCLEEFTSFLDFGRRHDIPLPLHGQMQLFVAMLALLAVILATSLAATRASGPRDLRLYAWYVVFAMMYSHALVNVAGVPLTHEYAPGAIVAGLLYLPFGVYVAVRALREGWLTPARLATALLVGAGSYVGMVLATLALGRAGH